MAAGYVMHLGSDDDAEASSVKTGYRSGSSGLRRVHVENQGRRPDFERDEPHEAFPEKIDKESGRVYMLCQCGAKWDFDPTENKDTYEEAPPINNLQKGLGPNVEFNLEKLNQIKESGFPPVRYPRSQ